MPSLSAFQNQDFPSASLYVIATPIGNLGDITLRALHILSLVDGIACEDKRHSLLLLKHYGIRKPMVAIHEHNEIEAAKKLMDHLQAGERWAYLSDAGTPGVNRCIKSIVSLGKSTAPGRRIPILWSASSAGVMARSAHRFINRLTGLHFTWSTRILEI
ncbi:MAG: hypothetical protein EB139_05685 [Burkholderiaceae bacterium]|nr:hypothetical protein [Burkholderiaceae bacterium]